MGQSQNIENLLCQSAQIKLPKHNTSQIYREIRDARVFSASTSPNPLSPHENTGGIQFEF